MNQQALTPGALLTGAPIAAIAVFLTAVTTPIRSSAAEIKLVAAAALEQVPSELLPQFERDTGNQLLQLMGL
jgi:ABC-type molybdate transport system substrate-binding protein